MRSLIYWFSFFLFALACKNSYQQLEVSANDAGPLYRVLPLDRPWQGDADKGFEYLVYGDYLESGIPLSFFAKEPKYTDTVLLRTGNNANQHYQYNAFLHRNGTEVMNGSCFSCHASPFMDSIYFGLGNSFTDFTERMPAKLLNFGMRTKYGKDSEEWEAFEDFGIFYRIIKPSVRMVQIGANPAYRLGEACGAQRNPTDLRYTPDKQFPMNQINIGSDVPPLWHVKKKNALYYNGMGRGDFRKLLMQASLLGLSDSSAAREIFRHFDDVVAWLESLEAPAYPRTINPNLASAGKMLFTDKCEKCHGTYGEASRYPNKMVALEEVKTDPYYARYILSVSGFPEWYNNSWFAKSPPYSQILPSAGYIAPPLDGVWATAPYLHNGSVPTLEDLLNSQQRPVYWQRSGKSNDYDWEKTGWNYQNVKHPKGAYTFDTTLPGYSNQGHFFADTLSDQEREALLEYLKTL